ncbi:MAG: terpene cyclase/mutase family protein [Defluviitaleaceae bacterium]|nr:terpene cyclase/mutase family protein [Defluviitaleaceae bacterium]
MGKFTAFLLILTMLIVPVAVQAEDTIPDWETAMYRSLDWIYDSVTPHPLVGSVGGEWAVLALARAGRVTADDAWVQGWLTDVERMLLEVDRLTREGHNIQHPPSAGTFPSGMRRWTDFQRLALALGSVGFNAADFNGRDLTAVYSTFVSVDERHALNMTINADAFALIALNAIPHERDSMDFIDWILASQNPTGTWAFGRLEIDTTSMVVQALAQYYDDNAEVRMAVDLALDWLRRQTFSDPESTAQMIVALTALGEDFAEEALVYVQWLLQWFDEESGGFRRSNSDDMIDPMSTEQGAYALVAYWRLVNGMTWLYDMSDMFEEAYEN